MTFDEWYEQNAKYMNTTDFEAWMLEAWEAGAKNEREACAKVCEQIERRKWEILTQGGKLEGLSPRDCAATIRARSEK